MSVTFTGGFPDVGGEVPVMGSGSTSMAGRLCTGLRTARVIDFFVLTLALVVVVVVVDSLILILVKAILVPVLIIDNN